jgi:L-ascorbate metabolism protein UlaG (beta-lactamase superfamily)
LKADTALLPIGENPAPEFQPAEEAASMSFWTE